MKLVQTTICCICAIVQVKNASDMLVVEAGGKIYYKLHKHLGKLKYKHANSPGRHRYTVTNRWQVFGGAKALNWMLRTLPWDLV